MSASLASWLRTWQELGAPALDDGLYERLMECWNEKHRHYHTVQHLGECFEQFAAVRNEAQHPAEVELAIWFHDAFYERILSGFLARPRLYSTEYFHAALEQRARDNLRRTLARLGN